jgi:hypothetical protein
MRTTLTEMEVVAAATRLPGAEETAPVEMTPTDHRRRTRVDLPAFAVDPRLDPDLPASLRRRIDRFSAVALLAVSSVLNALSTEERPPRERIGVFLANTRAGWSYGAPELGLLVDRGPEAMHAYQATAWFPAAAQGEVTIALDLRGCAKTAAGRASGFAEALWLARDALERRALDLAIVGAAESLVNGFVLQDWAVGTPLPGAGPAEGAVVFALRPPGPGSRVRLSGLRHTPGPVADTGEWVPTLAAAGRLHTAVADDRPNRTARVALGGGYEIDVRYPGDRDPTETEIETQTEMENR